MSAGKVRPEDQGPPKAKEAFGDEKKEDEEEKGQEQEEEDPKDGHTDNSIRGIVLRNVIAYCENTTVHGFAYLPGLQKIASKKETKPVQKPWLVLGLT